MNTMSRVLRVGAVCLFTLTGLAACVAAGYDGYGGGGYVGGIYEPGGYEYGGWGRGYRVGPPRGDIHREGEGGGRGRPAPSIAHGARGDSGHGGSAHGGGGRPH
jgi:hypothetical protein